MRASPTPETPGPPAPWLGLRLPLEILISPTRAFAAILARPEWLTAYVLSLAAGTVYLVLTGPAFLHLNCVPPPDGTPVPHTAADLRTQLNGFVAERATDIAIVFLIEIGLTAMVLTTISRFKGATTPYSVYASLAANCLVPGVLGMLLSGAAAAIHPVNSYANCRALVTAFPDNLAIFADPTRRSEVLFLAGPDVFTIWSSILLAFGFAKVGQVKFGTALGVSFALASVFSILLG